MANIWIGLNLTMGDDMQSSSITNRERIITFLVIGLLGNLLGWLIYKVSYDNLKFEDLRPTISWIVLFILEYCYSIFSSKIHLRRFHSPISFIFIQVIYLLPCCFRILLIRKYHLQRSIAYLSPIFPWLFD